LERGGKGFKGTEEMAKEGTKKGGVPLKKAGEGGVTREGETFLRLVRPDEAWSTGV